MERESEKLLIRMDQKLDDMAPRIERIEGALEKQKELCLIKSESCSRLFEARVGGSTFRWVIGILITLMLGIASVTTATKLDLSDLQHQLKELKKGLADPNTLIDGSE